MGVNQIWETGHRGEGGVIGIVDGLRDAFNRDHRMRADYEIDSGKENGKIIRIWLTK